MSAERMASIADVVPGVVSTITGEAMPETVNDTHVRFLRRHARVARQQSAFQVAATMDAIAERLERAIRTGQVIPIVE
jgi:hypothetical protein